MKQFNTALSAAALVLSSHSVSAAAAHASAEVVIHAPAGRVWNLLSNVDAWPQWNRAVDSVRLEGPMTVGTAFVWRSQGFTVKSTVTTIEAHTRLAWNGEAFGTKAKHEWVITPTEDGVIVTTSESFDGWLPRLMPQTMQSKLEETLPAWLDALKQEAERSAAAH